MSGLEFPLHPVTLCQSMLMYTSETEQYVVLSVGTFKRLTKWFYGIKGQHKLVASTN